MNVFVKDGEWYFEEGVLTSGNDPKDKLNSVKWPSDYVPMVFLTGDGHRNPPFQWTGRGVWKDFFPELVNDDKIVCHVEVYSDEVTADSVPGDLRKVYDRGKVFGWELPIWKDIQAVLEKCMNVYGILKSEETIAKSKIDTLVDDIVKLAQRGYLQQGLAAFAFKKLAGFLGKDPVPTGDMMALAVFLKDYQRDGIDLRSDAQIHAEVANTKINPLIERYPDHMHLITAGNRHLLRNPMYRYIRPPVGTFGVADPSQS